MILLRDYQEEALTAIRDAYKRGVRRQALGLPTGTGKTVVFGHLAHGAWRKGNGVLILAHRDELLEQAAEKLSLVDPEINGDLGRVQAGMDEVDHPIVIASVQTLARERRLRRLVDSRGFEVVVVDEAHHTAADTYQRVLKGIGSFDDDAMLTLGVTATPQRADKKDLGDTYEELVYHRDILWMIRRGYLCDLRGVQVKLDKFDPLKLRIRAGDFVAQEAADALTAAEAPKHIVGAWHEHAQGRKTIVFTPTVALASEIADAYNAAGIPAENVSITAHDQGERRAARERFRTGEMMIATNAMLWTEGFDEPSVECIVVARPTKSQPLYVQMVGRGTRTHPGKQDCLVLDMAGVTDRMDLTVLPLLAGLTREQIADPEIQQLIEDEGITAAADFLEERRLREGKIVAKRVNLFQRAEIAWTHVNDELWALSVGEDVLLLQADDQARWQVIRAPIDRGARNEILASGLDQGYAMGVAEEWVRRQQPKDGKPLATLISRGRRWREEPASEGQLAKLMKWRIEIPMGCSKGQASDLMTAQIARWKARRS